jgi:lysyl-tRNA synthetase class I
MYGGRTGVKPYGGYGVGASSASIGGKVMPMPTLPQRDIYEFVAKPMIEGVAAGENIVLERYSDIYEKNVQKILRISSEQKQISKEWIDGPLYVDTHLLQHSNPSRYVEIHESVSYRMLSSKNVEIATQLRIDDKNNIAELINLIQGREKLSPEEFKTALYAIPKSVTVSDLENKRLQKNFFELIYQLLFGKDSGPKLTTFLYEASKDSVLELLDII